MELTIKGEPNEISALLQRLKPIQADLPKLEKINDQFREMIYTRPPPSSSLINELLELNRKRKC